MNKTAVAFYGKVRIPTLGHKKTIDIARQLSESLDGDLRIGLSGASNPLSADKKKFYAEMLFGHPVESSQNLITFLSKLSENYSELHLVAGSDRVPEYRRIISKYNGKPDNQGNILFEFKKWKVHESKRTGTDISSTKIETLVESKDYAGFKKNYPTLTEQTRRKLYHNISEGLEMPAIGQTLSRDLMPQISGKTVKDFLKFLKKKNISFHKETIDPSTLKSTQSEFDSQKVIKLMYDETDDPLIVSNDAYVLDGHHRWLADHNKDRTSDAWVIDLPILELYRVAKEYSSALNESMDHKTFAPMVDSFVSFASDKLGIKSLPQVTLHSDSDASSFGGYAPGKKSISLVTKNRHPLDALRTLAHELVHHKQNEDGRIKDVSKEGATGSPIEDEANSMAGRLMRWYGKANPTHFKLAGLTEATFVVGVPCSGKDVIIKDRMTEDTQELDILQIFKAEQLSDSLIISCSAEDTNTIKLAKELLEHNGYITNLVFVDAQNDISKLRNQEREAKGQRVLSENIRFTKYQKAKDNMKTLKELFGSSMHVIDNNDVLLEKDMNAKFKQKVAQRGLERRLQVLPQHKKDKINDTYAIRSASNLHQKMQASMPSSIEQKRASEKIKVDDPVARAQLMTKKALGETKDKKKIRIVGKKKELPSVSDIDTHRQDDLKAIEKIKTSKEKRQIDIQNAAHTKFKASKKAQEPQPPVYTKKDVYNRNRLAHIKNADATGKFDYEAGKAAIEKDFEGSDPAIYHTSKKDAYKLLDSQHADSKKTKIRRAVEKVGKNTIKKVKEKLHYAKLDLQQRHDDRFDIATKKKDLRYVHGPVKGFVKGIVKYGVYEEKETSPSKREWGKKSLKDTYRKDTPGELGEDGIGPEIKPTSTSGGMTESRKLKSVTAIRENINR